MSMSTFGKLPSCCAMVRSNCFVSISTSKPWIVKVNKHEVWLFDKQYGK